MKDKNLKKPKIEWRQFLHDTNDYDALERALCSGRQIKSYEAYSAWMSKIEVNRDKKLDLSHDQQMTLSCLVEYNYFRNHNDIKADPEAVKIAKETRTNAAAQLRLIQSSFERNAISIKHSDFFNQHL